MGNGHLGVAQRSRQDNSANLASDEGLVKKSQNFIVYPLISRQMSRGVAAVRKFQEARFFGSIFACDMKFVRKFSNF